MHAQAVIPLTVFLTLVLLVGDYLIKCATADNTFRNLLLAAVLWALSVPGWFFAIKHDGISYIGGVFSVLSLIGTVSIGVFFFGEKLSLVEYVGLFFGMVSCILLFNRA